MTCRTSFLPPGVTVRYTLSLSLASISVPELLKSCDREIFFPLLRLPILSNIKGSGAGDTLLTTTGQFTEEENPVPFLLTIGTRFHDFSDKDQIRFNWSEQVEPAVFEGIGRYELFNRDDIQVSSFLFGVDIFKHTVITRLGGFGPAALESVTLEANQQALNLTIRSEGLPDIAELPLHEHRIVEKIESVISSLFKFSILADYQAHQGELA